MKNSFESKLPKDVKAQKEAANAATKSDTQSSLDPHLCEREKIIPYSDKLFQEATTGWLIATDQVTNRFSYQLCSLHKS